MTIDKAASPESIYFNPFAEQHASTAVDVRNGTPNHRPVLRRRTSSSDSFTSSSSSGLSVFGTAPKHMRIRTEGEVANGHHPLRSADLSSTFQNGAGVTRPNLTRILNIPPLVDAPTVPGASMMVEEPGGDEKVVLVHEVSLRDSLAGISLKYGISLAELRRANSLWSSDSIHLRKVLYIPLDKTSRAKQLAPPPLLIPTDDEETPASPAPAETANAVSIRRVPTSRLSFFPPHTRPQPDLPSPPTEGPPKRSRHVRYASSPGSGAGTPSAVAAASPPSLTSILAALPIQPSTRDTIIARLSYESTSSSYSDRDEGHELDDVRRRNSLDSLFSPGATPTSKPQSRDTNATTRTIWTRSHARTASASSVYGAPQPSYRRSAPLRTEQLEPSPIMQLPFATLLRKQKAPQNGDFDLLGLGNGEGQGETDDWDP
ncbi:Peptidoglycan-binding domain-containing protein 1 [Mycena kentingensis (nom. inval.)]|nr:Peptidoglycan-binding domain-containing protein 1 [Mycena kentingensis (nom. inval.)]